jgi:two-component system nitrogen regulation sensor histidine kinase NtrY
MQLNNRKLSRFILLGLSLCIILFSFLQFFKWRQVREIEIQWHRMQEEWRQNASAVTEYEFGKITDEMLAFASHAAEDLKYSQRSNPKLPISSAFSRILQGVAEQDLTLELVDSTGHIQAWAGRSVRMQYPSSGHNGISDSILLLTETRHRSYLTAGVPFIHRLLFLYVSKPIESHDPLKPEDIQTGFSRLCSQKLNCQVELIIPDSSVQQNQAGDSSFVLKDFNNKEIGSLQIQPQTKDARIAGLKVIFDRWITALIALTILLSGIYLLIKCRRMNLQWISLSLSIVILWGIRFGWLLIDFPRSIYSGMLFDPSLYASSFGFGLTATLGDLVLSTFTLLYSSLLALRTYIQYKRNEKTKSEPESILTLLLAAAAILMPFVLLGMLRAYGAALHSFFFDSTIRFYDPANIIPDVPAVLLQFSILCISTAAIIAACLCTDVVRRFWQSKRMFHLANPWIVIAAHYALCTAIFYHLDENPQVPFYSLGILLFAAYFLQVWVVERMRFQVLSLFTFATLWLMICSFLLSMPAIRMQGIAKAKKNVELIASEVARPADEWMSYMIQEGLRSASQGLQEKRLDADIPNAKEDNLAFRLWMQMPLSKRGYNSAVVLYDPAGNEMDRFVVGLNSYEQREILAKVFQGEEETVSNVQPSLSLNVPILYGAWTVLRNDQDSVAGSMAVVMSASREVQLGYNETGLLTVPSSTYGELSYRNYAVSEYRNGKLSSTTARAFTVPEFLTPDVSANFDSTSQYYWQKQDLDGNVFHTVYTRDLREPERIVAIHLAPLDIRLSVFNYLKTGFSLYVLIFFTFAAGVLKRRQWKKLIFSFRFRLFVGFTAISLLPLIFLGYYNRKFASEISDQGTSELLQREISTLEQRFSSYVENENDFVSGVNDDFCEALSAEYGIDISVYYGSELQASSRSELYRAGLLDRRLDGNVFEETTSKPNMVVYRTERMGLMTYTVASKAFKIGAKVVGVLSVPALSRQHILDMEIAQRNAFVFGTSLLAFCIMIAATGFLAHRMTRPLLELDRAAHQVGKGDLNISIASKSHDELGNLIRSFNEMTRELQENRKNLSKAERERAWREMAKQVAHEIRNPITPMKLSIQHLQQLFKDKAPLREDVMQSVMKSLMDQIDALSRIAAEFSNFAKMPEARYERFDLKNVISATVFLFSQIQDIRFHVVMPDVPMFLVADKDQMQRVIVNILRNAVQAMTSGGTIDIVLTEQSKNYNVRIHDTGPGIAPELIKKIFEPNFSTKTEGMGLGLAIVRKIIEDYGGVIHCESIVGKGTTFEINLPQ